ncbi:GFA family protein [Aestuariibius sp. 2305UL40-4]|uniref:GFA family protein n=1 Tax=Aestuariibius violaceus TaxID=3234132 RepID=UPI00345EBE23
MGTALAPRHDVAGRIAPPTIPGGSGDLDAARLSLIGKHYQDPVIWECSNHRTAWKASDFAAAGFDRSDGIADCPGMSAELPQMITGRCYCGSTTFRTTAPPTSVAYCHCNDCRRATGGPVAAFAAFEDGAIAFEPDEGKRVSMTPGVTRTFCETCGSSLTGRYDYLPGQVYVPLGVIDQADLLVPQMHAHEAQRLPWLHIRDDIERLDATATARLAELPSRE